MSISSNTLGWGLGGKGINHHYPFTLPHDAGQKYEVMRRVLEQIRYTENKLFSWFSLFVFARKKLDKCLQVTTHSRSPTQ